MIYIAKVLIIAFFIAIILVLLSTVKTGPRYRITRYINTGKYYYRPEKRYCWFFYKSLLKHDEILTIDEAKALIDRDKESKNNVVYSEY